PGGWGSAVDEPVDGPIGGSWGRGRHRGANRANTWRDSFRLLLIVAATEPDGSKSPQQAHLALLRMIDVPLTAFGPQLGLRRTRQFVDARHAARPIDRARRRRPGGGAR